MFKFSLLAAVICLFISGCAEIEPPGPEKILAPWSGVSPVRLGETKDSVRDKWGEPDEIRTLGADDIGLAKEEWIYYARYPEIPIDLQNLSKSKYLIFTGTSLTGYRSSGESQPSDKEGE